VSRPLLAGVSIEDISRLVGHASTVVTEKVIRKELRPVLTRGAETLDLVFKSEPVDRQVTDSGAPSRGDESAERGSTCRLVPADAILCIRCRRLLMSFW
jgi:hypothetical protein